MMKYGIRMPSCTTEIGKSNVAHCVDTALKIACRETHSEGAVLTLTNDDKLRFVDTGFVLVSYGGLIHVILFSFDIDAKE